MSNPVYKKVRIAWKYPVQPTSLQVGTVRIVRSTQPFEVEDALDQTLIDYREYSSDFTYYDDGYELEEGVKYYYMIICYGDIDDTIIAATGLYSITIPTSVEPPTNEFKPPHVDGYYVMLTRQDPSEVLLLVDHNNPNLSDADLNAMFNSINVFDKTGVNSLRNLVTLSNAPNKRGAFILDISSLSYETYKQISVTSYRPITVSAYEETTDPEGLNCIIVDNSGNSKRIQVIVNLQMIDPMTPANFTEQDAQNFLNSLKVFDKNNRDITEQVVVNPGPFNFIINLDFNTVLNDITSVKICNSESIRGVVL